MVLLADVSGSMRGERVRTVAATVGALAAELARDDLAVLAFWSDAAVLAHLGQPVPAARLPRLDVLLDTSGEQDEELARDLARLGRGRLRRIPGYAAVAPALSEIFTS